MAKTPPPAVINKSYDPAVPADAIQPHPENPRRGDLGLIEESIRTNGFYGALIVQESSGNILAGNHRYRAALAVGIKEFPVHYVEVDDEAAMRIALVDNRANDASEYDDRALLEWLNKMAATTTGLVGTGFDQDAHRELMQRTGAAAAGATEFLDGYREKASDEPQESDAAGGTQYFSLSYTVTAAERAEVLEALRAVREEHSLETSTEAFLRLCRDYMKG